MLISDSRVLRLFVLNWLAGAILGIVFATALLVLDIGGLRALLARSDLFWPGIALLYGGFTITCAGVVCGSAVMFQAGRDGDGPSDGLKTPATALAGIQLRQKR